MHGRGATGVTCICQVPPGPAVTLLTFSISNLRRGAPALLSLTLLNKEEDAGATASFSCDEAMSALHARS